MQSENVLPRVRLRRILKEHDVGPLAGFLHLLRPDAAGHLADVGRAEEEHAEAGLADAAGDALGQLAGQELLERSGGQS